MTKCFFVAQHCYVFLLKEPPVSAADLFNEFQAKFEDQNFKDLLDKRKQLPVYKHKEQILDAIARSQVVIIRGDTGSGKTTQVGK